MRMAETGHGRGINEAESQSGESTFPHSQDCRVIMQDDDYHGLAILFSVIATLISILSLVMYVAQHGWR